MLAFNTVNPWSSLYSTAAPVQPVAPPTFRMKTIVSWSDAADPGTETDVRV